MSRGGFDVGGDDVVVAVQGAQIRDELRANLTRRALDLVAFTLGPHRSERLFGMSFEAEKHVTKFCVELSTTLWSNNILTIQARKNKKNENKNIGCVPSVAPFFPRRDEDAAYGGVGVGVVVGSFARSHVSTVHLRAARARARLSTCVRSRRLGEKGEVWSLASSIHL